MRVNSGVTMTLLGSQRPRHLIGDADSSETSVRRTGKEVPFLVKSFLFAGWFLRCTSSGRKTRFEIPLLVELLDLM